MPAVPAPNPYAAGRAARLSGEPIYANPYPRARAECAEWERGWTEAEAEAKAEAKEAEGTTSCAPT